MDPRNPSVIEAREANSEYIVYNAQERNCWSRWNFERVSDGAILASGGLQSMLALLKLFPNSRRASWAEDTLRMKPGIFALEYNYDEIFKQATLGKKDYK
jgi:hypothetical protein